jgi:hypothetical protein
MSWSPSRSWPGPCGAGVRSGPPLGVPPENAAFGPALVLDSATIPGAARVAAPIA